MTSNVFIKLPLLSKISAFYPYEFERFYVYYMDLLKSDRGWYNINILLKFICLIFFYIWSTVQGFQDFFPFLFFYPLSLSFSISHFLSIYYQIVEQILERFSIWIPFSLCITSSWELYIITTAQTFLILPFHH